jgi:hypothetical protein
MFVCCVCCVLSGRGLCDELITRPEDSNRLWRVVVCDHETSWYEEAIARAGLQRQRKHQQFNLIFAVTSSMFSRGGELLTAELRISCTVTSNTSIQFIMFSVNKYDVLSSLIPQNNYDAKINMFSRALTMRFVY